MLERRQHILEAIEKVGRLSVVELSTRFEVSEATIRHDLQALSEQGLLLRTVGGALSTNTTKEFSFDIRQQQRGTQKMRIAHTAASLVNSGDIIILDASTTVYAIIPHLKNLRELTVITNSLKVALSLFDASQIQVILAGGNLRRGSISLVGPMHESFPQEINAQIGFFGARGLTVEEGLTEVNFHEATMKRTMIDRCRQVVGVLDSHKWGKVATHTFAHLKQIDILITDHDAPKDMVYQVQQHEVEVMLV